MPDEFHTLGAVIKIPLGKQIFPPWDIILGDHNKSVYSFRFHVGHVRANGIGKQLRLIDMLLIQHPISVYIPHHACNGHPVDSHISNHAHLRIIFKNIHTIPDEIRIDNKRVMVQVYLVFGPGVLHGLIIACSQGLCFLYRKNIDLHPFRHL